MPFALSSSSPPCFSSLFSPVYGDWACPARRAPSPRCRHPRTPEYEMLQTSGRAAACEQRERWYEKIDMEGLNMKAMRTKTHPSSGPPFIRSKTWAGFRSCLNLRRNLTPWLSPLLEFTRTSRGLAQDPEVAFQKPDYQELGVKEKKKSKNNRKTILKRVRRYLRCWYTKKKKKSACKSKILNTSYWTYKNNL